MQVAASGTGPEDSDLDRGATEPRGASMPSVAVLLHLLLVELRCCYILYVSIFWLIWTGTESLYASLRGQEWCKVPSCTKSILAQRNCIGSGIMSAMWTFDLNFANEELCVRFHGTNFAGWLNLIALVLLLVFVMLAIWRTFTEGAMEFRSGRYITFTTYWLKSYPEMKWVAMISQLYVIFSYLVVPVIIGFKIPILDDVGVSRGDLLWEFLTETLVTYVAVAVSAWYVVAENPRLLDPANKHLDSIIFRRIPIPARKHMAFCCRISWAINALSVFLQTNNDFMISFEAAVMEAKSGKPEMMRLMMEKSAYHQDSLNNLHGWDNVKNPQFVNHDMLVQEAGAATKAA